MSRIPLIDRQNADTEQEALLKGIQSGLGMVPNILKVLANSPSALRAYLGLNGIASEGVLDAKTRERIALAVAEQNACQYCVSAHTAIGRKAGLDGTEILANRQGSSGDPKAAAALAFARTLVAHTGDLTDAEFAAVRNAGHSDAEIVEIIAHVAMNIFTNLIGKATRVDIDFPEVQLGAAA